MSGLIFGFSYSLSYTCARTLSTLYGYDALRTGLVLLSNGAGEFVCSSLHHDASDTTPVTGSMCGSTLGGRWSDRMLMELKSQHGGKMHPEVGVPHCHHPSSSP